MRSCYNEETTDMFTREKKIGELILDIESSSPQKIMQRKKNELVQLWNDPSLLLELSGNIGALFVRFLLRQLNLDESHVFRWRLEDKFRQYQIIDYYSTNSMPETIALSEILFEIDGINKATDLCNNGFFLKSNFGFGSGRNYSYDKTDDLNRIAQLYQFQENIGEQWILQRKLVFNEEFRIHTFGRDVIYGLSFLTEGKTPVRFREAEIFLIDTLKKLPNTLLNGTLIGWDIGITDNDDFIIIEANITGFHPIYYRGFQTSGFFGDNLYGPILCACLNNYFKYKYNVGIGSIDNALLASNMFFQDFVLYDAGFDDKFFDILHHENGDRNVAAIIYFGYTPIPHLVTLLEYFNMISFASTYYVIISGTLITEIKQLYSHNKFIKVILEESLVDNSRQLVIQQFDFIDRKKFYCDQLINELHETIHYVA
jgi:hypothetical protein